MEIQISDAPRFRRGDSNADSQLNVADAIATLVQLFIGGAPLPCHKSADFDDNGVLTLQDAMGELIHLFVDNLAPPEPFAACGVDPTADDLPCEKFKPCE
jgi:hypothetical protein